jgi:hypothetical protein
MKGKISKGMWERGKNNGKGGGDFERVRKIYGLYKWKK